jgi:hypothetical protein
MKTTKVFISAILTVLVLFAAPYTGSTLNSQNSDGYPEFDWSLVYPGGIDGGDVYDGGDLGEATLICSSGSWGRCFQWCWIWEQSDSLFGEYDCVFTGMTKNYCHHLYAKIANLLYLPQWFDLNE